MPLLFLLYLFSLPTFALRSFSEAKGALPLIHRDNPRTLYCGCRYQGKDVDLKSCGYQVWKNERRARRVEWEHVVPAEAFGRSFEEWREGHPKCVRKKKKFKGRRCARKNKEFARMEGDLYNLYPVIGELNGLRSNFSMAELGEGPLKAGKSFGGCKARIHGRKFEPRNEAKGIIARIYFYMDETYPGRGIISRKNRKLFEAWDRTHPATQDECERGKRIEALQGTSNPVLKKACLLVR